MSSDKQKLEQWEVFRRNLKKATSVTTNETNAEKRNRIVKLERSPELWFKYYFPNYAYAEPAAFHKRATKRILKNQKWFEVRAWSRELAKSARTMMEVTYMAMTGNVKNVLMVSASEDSATDLLKPYKINFESNLRLINDYGKQQSFGDWKDGDFITLNGVSFLGIGAKQSPRGTRNEEIRPDCIIVDDLETDEMSRNQERLNDVWKWVEQALIPTVSVSQNKRFIFLGNIISPEGLIVKASRVADHFEKINIRDKNGKSTWAEKNTEEDIDWMLSKLSYISQQKEYFNNPIIEGSVFESIDYRKLAALSQYKFLLAYCDPSWKDGKKNDYKAVTVIGRFENQYHIHDVFCKQTSFAELAQWSCAIFDKYNKKIPLYWYMESNATQTYIFDQVNQHIHQLGYTFSYVEDLRKKGDKFSRIESLLQPLHQQGNLLFNEKLKDTEHMKAAEAQMLALNPALTAHDDFPDSLHGAVSLAQEKQAEMQPPVWGKRRKSKNRF